MSTWMRTVGGENELSWVEVRGDMGLLYVVDAK